MELLMRFAEKTEVESVPIEQRSRQELLDLLEKTRSTMEQAELLVTPLFFCLQYTALQGWTMPNTYDLPTRLPLYKVPYNQSLFTYLYDYLSEHVCLS